MEEMQKIQVDILKGIHEDLKGIAARDQDCLQIIRGDLKELRMIVVGIDGQNGLRSSAKKNEIDIDNLKRWQTQFMAVFAVIQLIGVPVAIYVITHLIP